MKKILLLGLVFVLLAGSLACALLAAKPDSGEVEMNTEVVKEAVTETSSSTAAVPTETKTQTMQATATRTPSPTIDISLLTPTFAAGDQRVRNIDDMVMAYIPSGEFMMGSDKYDIESPVHNVFLDAYWIDQYEVTNAQYALCEDAGVCTAPFSKRSLTVKDYYGNPDYANYPMVNIDWYQAQAYCEWVGGRLPTEAEWEKAARGTDERAYPWGNTEPNADLLNYNDNLGDTAAVGSYPMGISPYGVYDMAGNVKEWTADYWGSAYYEVSLAGNPTGPESGSARVVRNACFGNMGDFARATYHNYFAPGNSGNYLGFRCVMDAVEP